MKASRFVKTISTNVISYGIDNYEKKVIFIFEERAMGDILIIGNGFDLAHGYPTKYSDYLFLVKNIECFEKELELRRCGKSEDSIFDRYFYKGVLDKIDIINQFISIAKVNAWIYYFSNCDAEIN